MENQALIKSLMCLIRLYASMMGDSPIAISVSISFFMQKKQSWTSKGELNMGDSKDVVDFRVKEVNRRRSINEWNLFWEKEGYFRAKGIDSKT